MFGIMIRMPLAKQRQELVAGRDIAVRAPRRVDVELVLCEIRQDASRPHVVVLRDSSPAGGGVRTSLYRTSGAPTRVRWE